MLAATGGINTHRGAIFMLGLLCAAAGAVAARADGAPHPARLRDALRRHWGDALAARSQRTSTLPGGIAARRHGLRSASEEAALAFPVLFETALPALTRGAGPRPDAAAGAARHLVPRHGRAGRQQPRASRRAGRPALCAARGAGVPGRGRRGAARRTRRRRTPLPTTSWRGACRPAARPTRWPRPAGCTRVCARLHELRAAVLRPGHPASGDAAVAGRRRHRARHARAPRRRRLAPCAGRSRPGPNATPTRRPC